MPFWEGGTHILDVFRLHLDSRKDDIARKYFKTRDLKLLNVTIPACCISFLSWESFFIYYVTRVSGLKTSYIISHMLCTKASTNMHKRKGFLHKKTCETKWSNTYVMDCIRVCKIDIIKVVYSLLQFHVSAAHLRKMNLHSCLHHGK